MWTTLMPSRPKTEIQIVIFTKISNAVITKYAHTPSISLPLSLQILTKLVEASTLWDSWEISVQPQRDKLRWPQKHYLVPRKQTTAVLIQLKLGLLNGIQTFILFVLVDNHSLNVTVSSTSKSNAENTHSKLP